MAVLRASQAVDVASSAAVEQQAVTRQYDEIIAAHYDRDPQAVTRTALGRAVQHLQAAGVLDATAPPGTALDVGLGTGLFLELLAAQSQRTLLPHGLDVSRSMAAVACSRIPGLKVAIEDAARLDSVFVGDAFDLLCTHFVTGFVPLESLAPMALRKIAPGGYWSFVGGTSAGYPNLRRKASSGIVRLAAGGRRWRADAGLTPADTAAVVALLEKSGFEIVAAETYEPRLRFDDFAQFLEFGYHGGWLTPQIEKLGLHRAGPRVRALLDRLVFPIDDCHRIATVLARRPAADGPQADATPRRG